MRASRASARTAAACAPKLIYVDLGVSWCNTLERYRRVVPAGRGAQPWGGVGFEEYLVYRCFASADCLEDQFRFLWRLLDGSARCS